MEAARRFEAAGKVGVSSAFFVLEQVVLGQCLEAVLEAVLQRPSVRGIERRVEERGDRVGRGIEKGFRRGGQRIYRDIPEALRALIEPVVADHGCELVDVEVARNRGTGLLRITVDNPSGDGRVEISRCVTISREIETLLDAGDAMPGAYQLEVSSPGLDRVLGREKDFIAAISQEVKLRTRRPLDGRKRYRGRLESVEAGVLKVRVDGEMVLIPIEEVEKANSIYEFTSADFAKESSRRGSSQSGGM